MSGRHADRQRPERPVSRRDPSSVLLVGGFAGFLAVLGLAMGLSASAVFSLQEFGSPYAIFVRQAIWIAVGLAVMGVTATVDYRVWRRAGVPMFVVSVLLLCLVLLPGVGISAYGATRWLGAGPLRIQPSELAKLAVLLVCADVLARKERLLDDPLHMLVPCVPVLAGCALLIMLQPDLGTTLSLAGIVLVMLFVAGARLGHLALLGGTGLAATLALTYLEPFRRARVLAFLDPWKHAGTSGYQVVQSLIAIGSGGTTGVGLGASRQKWMFLPNAHTDFIYAVIGEELGLVGSVIVLGLVLGLVLVCVRAARRAPDAFGRILAAGLAGWIAVQAIINVGAVTGVLPITGIPLPLVSVGGTNSVVILAAVGIVMSVARAGDREAGRRRRRTRKAGGARAEG